jgi:hypothetical protein
MCPTVLGHGVYKDDIDYGVFCGEWCIGRIYQTRTGPQSLRWALHAPSKPGEVRTSNQVASRLIVPFSPGGATDVAARLWAEKMRSTLGTVVIENKGGGGGVIGATELVRSQPDGHTLLFGNTSTQVLIPGGLCWHLHHVSVAHLHSGARVGAGAHAYGVHRLRQGQPNQAVIWHKRCRERS